MKFTDFIKKISWKSAQQYYFENKYYSHIKKIIKKTGRIEESYSYFLVSKKPGKIGFSMLAYRATQNPGIIKYDAPCYKVFENKMFLNKTDVTANVRPEFINDLYLELESCSHNTSAFGVRERNG